MLKISSTVRVLVRFDHWRFCFDRMSFYSALQIEYVIQWAKECGTSAFFERIREKERVSKGERETERKRVSERE